MPQIQYDRDEAVQYAKRWALSRNPAYAAFDQLGGDSTNFVSQCVFTPDMGWFYQSMQQRSAPWSGVPYLYQFLTENNGLGPYGENLPLFQTQPGDVIQLSFDGERFTQSLLVTAVDGQPAPDTIHAATHNEDVEDKTLSDYNYKSFRLIHIEGVRR